MIAEVKDSNSAGQGVRALLPGGLRDLLAPQAEFESGVVAELNAAFASFGYDRITPPLLEFEETLLQGPGQNHGQRMFRLMDPDTQRVMALRADMTVQVARIAETRLTDQPRPLRLAYSGNVVRVKGSQVRPSRQFLQAGVELIGSASLEAELEVITLAIEALGRVGVKDLTLDLTVAPLVGMVADKLKLDDEQRATAIVALDKKDMGALDAFGAEAKAMLTGILNAAGAAGSGLEKLRNLELSGAAGQLVARLGRLVEALETLHPDIGLTIDPGETHGFEYKTGIGFALFAPGVRGELGRGGRYMARKADGSEEPATGFSIYLDSILLALPTPERAARLYVPHGTAPSIAAALRADGHRTVQGLDPDADVMKEARDLGCSHVYKDGKADPVE